MRRVFIKPDLTMYFSAMPMIGKYLEAEYKAVNNYEGMFDLCYKWLNEEETSKNPVRKNHLKAASNYLYSLLTNKSYESKNFESL